MHGLADNDPLSDGHYYLVSVTTGRAWHAATKSRVHLVLTGEMGETGVRSLDDGEHKARHATLRIRIRTGHFVLLDALLSHYRATAVPCLVMLSASSAAARCTCC